MPCLDTNFLIDLLRGDPEAQRKMSALEDGKTIIATTAMNVCELYKGAYKSERVKENTVAAEQILKNLVIYNFDSAAAKEAAKITEELRKNGQPIGAMDALVAGTAIANNETLLTRDIEHYKRIRKLRVETW